jgi:hypothetical protein
MFLQGPPSPYDSISEVSCLCCNLTEPKEINCQVGEAELPTSARRAGFPSSHSLCSQLCFAQGPGQADVLGSCDE